MITCAASQTPLFDEDGSFAGSVVVFHDVSEKKLAEQKVKRFAEIIEAADAGNAISGVKEMLIEQGMNDFLSKPIDRTLLTEILMKWLSKHKVHVQGSADHTAIAQEIGDKKVSGFIQSLRSLPEINVDSSLEAMGGLEDLYESTFMIVRRMLPQNIRKLDAYLEKNSLYDFAIEIHGLKGALNNIGCWELGDSMQRIWEKLQKQRIRLIAAGIILTSSVAFWRFKKKSRRSLTV